jgi:hypothetical protein
MSAKFKNLGEAFGNFYGWPYFTLLVGVICLVPIYVSIVPWHYYSDAWAANARALGLAFLCGALVGLTEIASRYRDEQVKAITSPDGFVYILFNGAISTFALILIWHFRDNPAFSALKNNPVGAALAAGFGATAVMRTRIAVIKGSDNKDVSIGPDIVLSLLMTMIDRRIDRWRSLVRHRIIEQSFGELRALGSIDDASEYLKAALNSFQNISDSDKKEVNAQIEQNKSANVRDPYIKLTTLGYIFLTIAGEENYYQVLREAKTIQTRDGQIGPSGPLGAVSNGPTLPIPASSPTPLVGTPLPPTPPPPTPPP